MQNLHTHCLLCDGRDSPEEMAAAALEMGFDSLGFSSHSYTAFDLEPCLKDEDEYRKRILRLKASYLGRLRIYLGLEQDLFSPIPRPGLDYLIGSVHYVLRDKEYIPVDNTPELLSDGVRRLFSCDLEEFVLEYYRLVASVREVTGCDIVGHFDLITKFERACPELSKTGSLGSVEEEKKRAIKRLASQDAVFEVNTGAMARGYKDCPYPSFSSLEYIRSLNGRVTISSDCHDKRYLDYGFREAAGLIREAGFDCFYELRPEFSDADRRFVKIHLY